MSEEYGLREFIDMLNEKADELQTLQDYTIDKIKEAEFRGSEMTFRAIADGLEDLLSEE